MEGFGVIVEFCPTLNGTESLSCSGLYMGKGVVLTHGTIVIDVLKDKKSIPLLQELWSRGYASTKSGLLRTLLLDTQSRFKVILPGDQHSKEDACALPGKAQDSYHHLSPECCKSADKPPVSVLPSCGEKQVLFLGNEVKKQTSSLFVETCNYKSLPAAVERIFVQPGIKESLSKIMPASQGWKFSEAKEQCQHENETDLENLILSTFVLLNVESDESNKKEITDQKLMDTTRLLISISSLSPKGTGVYVESTPFGSLSPSVFLNSLSHGIISNVSSGAGDILLTDARCVMGSEGAPVFMFRGNKNYLCGMVISPFCWKNGEWLGLTLLASMKSILQALLMSLEVHDGIRENEATLNKNRSLNEQKSEFTVSFRRDITPNPSSVTKPHISQGRYLNQENITKLDGSVVAVCCGGGWGSGVVVSTSPGIILTCAHVTQPAEDGIVRIMLSDGQNIRGWVVYQTRPIQSKNQQEQDIPNPVVWDLAVVITASSLPHSLPVASHLPQKGSPVIVAGYGLFSPNNLPAPSLSMGIISKVIGLPVSLLYWQSHSVNDWFNNDKDKGEYSGMAVNQVCDEVQEIGSSVVSHVYAKTTQEFQDSLTLNSIISERTVDGRALMNSDRNGLVPMLMQTSCAVYGGTSGGPVVSLDPQRGMQVIGIIVCNTNDTTNKASFPHINLAVPIPAICHIIRTFLSSGDKTVLEFLEVECSAASHLWALGHVPQSRL